MHEFLLPLHVYSYLGYPAIDGLPAQPPFTISIEKSIQHHDQHFNHGTDKDTATSITIKQFWYTITRLRQRS
jgi:hypothetical protein